MQDDSRDDGEDDGCLAHGGKDIVILGAVGLDVVVYPREEDAEDVSTETTKYESNTPESAVDRAFEELLG